MTTSILATILLAAIFHSIWNIIANKSTHNETLLWLQMVVANIVLTPFIICNYSFPNPKAWPTLIASGLLQAFYYLFLAKCYQIGNLSIVYPFVRGSAPVFVCLFSFILGTEHLSFPIILALLLTVLGIYIVNMPNLSLDSLTAPIKTLIKDKSTRLSMLIGIIIAFYTLIDKQNVKYCEPMLVYYIICVIPCLILAPYIIRKGEIKAELEGFGKFKVCFVSLFTFLAYFLVLTAMSQTDASYVSSIREVSVVFVTIYQSFYTKDYDWLPKVLGSAIIFVGIFLMSYF